MDLDVNFSGLPLSNNNFLKSGVIFNHYTCTHVSKIKLSFLETWRRISNSIQMFNRIRECMSWTTRSELLHKPLRTAKSWSFSVRKCWQTNETIDYVNISVKAWNSRISQHISATNQCLWVSFRIKNWPIFFPLLGIRPLWKKRLVYKMKIIITEQACKIIVLIVTLNSIILNVCIEVLQYQRNNDNKWCARHEATTKRLFTCL